MKVAIVHDDLMQWGGAERVLEGICEAFPDAPIFTSLFDKKNKELYGRFGSKKVITSFLQRIPFSKKLYKVFLPLYPIAFEQFDFTGYDLVISHTTRFAKAIITKPETIHICYSHTPPRFLWNFSGETTPKFLKKYFDWLRKFDKITSNRPDYYLAGSENAKQRIKQIYSKSSTVLYPFIDTERFKNVESFDGGYFLVISRLNKYKRIDLAIEACIKLGVPLKIIGIGSEMHRLLANSYSQLAKGSRIEFLGNLSDEMVVEVLAGCKAVIVPGIEDFGLVSLEAQAVGKPVVAFKEGGVEETVINGKTGLFFDAQTVDNLMTALSSMDSLKIDPDKCKENANSFSRAKFVENLTSSVRALI